MFPVVGWPPRCILRSLTGVPCPFCGMTTGTLALLHGDVAGTVAANPGAPLFAIAVLVLALTRFGEFGQTWRAEVAERALRWRLRRWVWPALTGMWAFEIVRFSG